jgi:hypothetical protein
MHNHFENVFETIEVLILFHEIKISNLLLFHDYFEFQINNGSFIIMF